MSSDTKKGQGSLLYWIIPILVTLIIGILQFLPPIASFPTMSIKLQVSPADNHISNLQLKNYGNIPATNVLLTLNLPSEIITYKVFTTETHSISQNKSNILQIFFPRFSNGDGSVLSIDTIIGKETNISNKNYIAYVTHDKGSLMIDSPSALIETTKQQGPTIERIFSILGISAFFGYFGFGMFRAAFVFRKSNFPGARPRAIVSTIVAFFFVGFVIFFILVGLELVRFKV